MVTEKQGSSLKKIKRGGGFEIKCGFNTSLDNIK